MDLFQLSKLLMDLSHGSIPAIILLISVFFFCSGLLLVQVFLVQIFFLVQILAGNQKLPYTRYSSRIAGAKECV